MKSILIILILCSGIANAQDFVITETISKEKSADLSSTEDTAKLKVTNNKDLTLTDKVCYSETSKVAFYEALLSVNNFDIELTDSDAVVIKSAEEMIDKLKDKTLYASSN